MTFQNNQKNIEVNTVVSEWKPEGLNQNRTEWLKIEPEAVHENEAVSVDVRSQLWDGKGSNFLNGNVWLTEEAKSVSVSAYSSRIESNKNFTSSYRVEVQVWMRADGTATITIKGAKGIETQLVNGNTQIDVIPQINE